MMNSSERPGSSSDSSVTKSWIDIRDDHVPIVEKNNNTHQQALKQGDEQKEEGEKKEALVLPENTADTDSNSSNNNNDLLLLSSPSFIETGGDELLQSTSSSSPSLSPLIIERMHTHHPHNSNNKNSDNKSNNNSSSSEDVCSVLSSPVSGTEHIQGDSSSGESFDVTDAFDISVSKGNRRASGDHLMIRSKEPSTTASPASSVGQLSEDEDPIESTRRGRSASMSSRKRRGPQMGQGYFATPSSNTAPSSMVSSSSRNALAQITASALSSSSSAHLSSSASTPSLIAAPLPPPSPPLSSSSSSSSTSSSSSHSEELSLNNVFPSCVLPPQFLPLLQAINAKAVSMSLVSFLVGVMVAYWWIKRQASLKKTDRLQTEASLRQMLALKEAEVNRLSSLFEKYLSRPLLLRYLPNRF